VLRTEVSVPSQSASKIEAGTVWRRRDAWSPVLSLPAFHVSNPEVSTRATWEIEALRFDGFLALPTYYVLVLYVLVPLGSELGL
jgi:hypothetical protein